MGVEERGGHASNIRLDHFKFASYGPAVDVGCSVYDTGLVYLATSLLV